MTDIPEDVMKDAENALDKADRNQCSLVNDGRKCPCDGLRVPCFEETKIIARAIMEARDKALEDAAAVADEEDKNEPPGIYSAIHIASAIRAMKSTARDVKEK